MQILLPYLTRNGSGLQRNMSGNKAISPYFNKKQGVQSNKKANYI
jgi:hypothetical protein